MEAWLEAAGAPKDLVQIVHGYAEAGNAVVTGGSDKVVFVGSTGVGRAVMRAAADTLRIVTLSMSTPATRAMASWKTALAAAVSASSAVMPENAAAPAITS